MKLSTVLFRNAGTKLLALVVACAAWYLLSAERRERISERSYRLPLSIVNIPAGTIIVSPLPDAVDVRLRGLHRAAAGCQPRSSRPSSTCWAQARARSDTSGPRGHQRRAASR
jgi:hypothetical protein